MPKNLKQRLKGKCAQLSDEVMLFAVILLMVFIAVVFKLFSLLTGISFLPLILFYLMILLIATIYFSILAIQNQKDFNR